MNDLINRLRNQGQITLYLEAADRIEQLQCDLETERQRLVACSVAALGYFDGCCDEYKSASLNDVLSLRDQLTEAKKQRDELLAALQLIESMDGTDCWWKYQETARAAIASVKGESN